MRFSVAALLFGASAASALKFKTKGSPVDNVIELLEDLKAQTEDEGKKEHKVYDNYACWCKDSTQEKSDVILECQTDIDRLAADIDAGKGKKAKLEKEIAELEQFIIDLDKEVQEKEADYQAEKTKRDAVIADLTKATTSLAKAIEAMKKSIPTALLDVSVKETIRKNVLVAQALGMKVAKETVSFLQSEGPDREGYGFHSDGIIKTLEELDTEFNDNLSDEKSELEKLTKAMEEYRAAKADLREAKVADKDSKSEQLTETVKQLGEDTREMVSTRKELADASLYLKDLTASCELKGRTWDQRSTMRSNELKALTAALDIIKGKVVDKNSVNKRAFLVQKVAKVHVANQDYRESDMSGFNFLQTKKSKNLLAVRQRLVAKAMSELEVKATKLHQVEMLELALKNKEGPFEKVKKLIQSLIERLLKEAAEEATHKGFCDTEMGKAKKQRDFKMEAANKINAETEANEATLAAAKQKIEELTDEIDVTEKELLEATDERTEEKENNLKDIADAKEGLGAVKEALKILKDFYKGEHGAGGANSATVSLLQESPIVADEPESPFGGGEAYQGNQGAAGGILGMLEVIQTDFERTITSVSADEKDAAAEFVKFDRTSKVSIASMKTEKKNNEAVKAEMEIAIDNGMEDLKTNQKLVDAAIKTLEDLQPTCVDTGMSYEERVAKREEEIDALKTALCQLDPEGNEPDCA